MDPVERIRENLAFNVEFHLTPHTTGGTDEWARRKHEAIAIYKALTHAQALVVGRVVLDAYDACLRRERDEHLTIPISTDPVEHLQFLAVFQPTAMRELYPEVIARDRLLWHSEIFCAGDAATRDVLLARLPWAELASGTVEEFTEATHLFACLAWIRDDAVVARFSEWRDVKIIWRPNEVQITRDPSIVGQSSTRPLTSVTYEAGWELAADGTRRNLCTDRWRKLTPATSDEASNAVVSVGGLMDGQCSWCGRDLAAILDLDLRASELGFLGLSGERLHIPFCSWCSYIGGNGPLFWYVDMSGGASWHEANGERPTQGAQLDTSREWDLSWTQVHYTPGLEHANPYASLVAENDFDPHRLGGLPEWVQYPEYPICPDCGRSLRFLGQLDADEHLHGEGLVYAFLCEECGVAATVQQQT